LSANDVIQQNQIYALNGMSAMQQQSQPNLPARIARIESVTPYRLGGGMFAPSDFSPLDSGGLIDGKLNLATSSSISFMGSMAPAVVDGVFSVGSATDSTATIYYDGTNSSRVFLLRRADQTVSVIPPNNISLSGLTSSAVYTAYAYWTPFNECGLGWASGLAGTPLIAFTAAATATQIKQAVAQQHFAGREEIGSIQWTQPAPAGSTSPGPPTNPPNPDPGSCVMIGTTLKPLGSEPIDTQNYRWEDWVRIETEPGGCFVRGLNCTPDHPLYDAEKGKVRADSFVGKNRWIMTDNGEEKVIRTAQFIKGCTKVQAHMKRGHLFFANGFLSHNFKLEAGAVS